MAQLEEIQTLIGVLEQGPDRRRQAQESLIDLGEVVVEALIEVVATGEGQKRWAAAEVLGKLADPRAFDALAAVLESENPMLGGIAAKALLNFEGRDILPILVQAFPKVRILTQQQILLAMQSLNDRRAVPMLVEQLGRSDSAVLQTAIIQTLGKLGDPAAVSAVRAFVNDSNPHLREWAETTIQKLAGIPPD